MCEPTMPIDRLKDMRFSLASMPEVMERGSCRRRQIEMMVSGIREDLDWVIANLERAGEGQKNFGLRKYDQACVSGDGGKR